MHPQLTSGRESDFKPDRGRSLVEMDGQPHLTLIVYAAITLCVCVFVCVSSQTYHRRFSLPRAFLTGDRIAAFRTPMPYRGICVKRLKVPARVQTPDKSNTEPSDLIIQTVDVQFTPDPTTSLPPAAQKSRGVVKEPMPSLAESVANTARYVWSHPAKAARKERDGVMTLYCSSQALSEKII